MNRQLSQSGQSTVEFVVASLVLAPLFLIIPLLGKYLDLAQTTAIASRYVAFEGAVHHSSSEGGWKTDSELATEVRRRFYSRNDLSVKTNDVVSEVDGDRNPLWVDHRGDSLLPRFNNISVATEKSSINTIFGGVTSFTDFLDHFDLPSENLYRGTVNVQLANVAGLAPFDAINLSMTRKTVVLVDPWAAKGINDVRAKVQNSQAVLPTAVLGVAVVAFRPVFNKLTEPNASLPDVGKVEPDWVPADRLQPY